MAREEPLQPVIILMCSVDAWCKCCNSNDFRITIFKCILGGVDFGSILGGWIIVVVVGYWWLFWDNGGGSGCHCFCMGGSCISY